MNGPEFTRPPESTPALEGGLPIRRQRILGHSLLEAILASSLGTLVALLLLSILPGALGGMAASAHQMQACDLAGEVLSKVEALPFASLPVGRTFDGRVPTEALNSGQPAQFPPAPYPFVQRRFVEGSRERVVDYQVSVAVQQGRDRDGAVAADLVQVIVRIDWKTFSPWGRAHPHHLEVSTLVVDQS